MSAIADDETEHAELAWAVARWAEPRLDCPTRERVARARHQALAEITVTAGPGLSDAAAGAVGLPSAAITRLLAARFAQRLREQPTA
jgi:hypothetical protein